MKRGLVRILSSSFLSLFATVSSLACGINNSTITNLPPNPSGYYEVYAMNNSGELTGFFVEGGVHGPHAFTYDSGALADLGTLGGDNSFAFSINAAGQVVGNADLSVAGQTHAFLSAGGPLTDLGTLGGSVSSASVISDSGFIAGDSFLQGELGPVAFLYSNNVMVGLGTLGSSYSSAFAVNNAGTVVGESGISTGDIHGFVYSNGLMSDLGTLGGNYSSAFALNNAGTIVGESAIAGGDVHAFIDAGGVMNDLGTLGGNYSSAFVINTNGQAIGNGTLSDNQTFHAFFYDGGPIADLGTLGGTSCSAAALNNLGQIVGTSTLSDGTTSHAFLWQKGTMVDLNTLLPTNSGWELVSALYLNDSGRVVGFGNYAGSSQWFIMDLAKGNSAPIANAGANQTIDCQAQVTLDGSASSDPDNDPLTYQWALGGSVLGTNATLTASLPLGTNVVTLTVTDTCGATGQTSVVVTVLDTTPPTGACPSDMTANSDANCQAAVPDVASQVVANDNCTPQSSIKITQDPVAGTMVGLGAHPISIKVTDNSGNASTCSVLFTVVDKTAPTIVSVPTPPVVSVGANCQGAVPNVLNGVVVTDNCTAANQINLSQNPAAGAMLGTGQYTIVVTATDASGNSSTANVSLQVADTTAPTIQSVPGPVSISVGANCQGAVPDILGSVSASDNCTPATQLSLSQSPAAGTLLNAGQYTIVVTVTDASGNSSSANVALSVADTTAPTIQNVPAPLTVSADANCSGTVPDILGSVVAFDNCTPANQLIMTQNPAAGTVLSKGQYLIVVTVTDLAGNSSTANVALTIADTTPPAIQSLTASPDLLTPPNHQVVPITISAVVSDNCDSAPVSKIINVTCNETLAPGDVQITGNLTVNLAATRNPSGNGRVYTITVQATDASGNASTSTVPVVVPKGNGNGNGSGNGKK